MKLSAAPASLAVATLLALSCLIAWPSSAEAHRDGCHAHHSCPSDSGSYVCGDTGNFSECGYTSLPEERVEVYDYDAPRRPEVSGPKSRPSGRVAVTVTAERGSKLAVESGGKTVYETVAKGGPQAIVFKGLEGRHSYSVQATDSADNASDVATFKADADGVAPSLEGATITDASPEDSYTKLTIAPGESSEYSIAVDGRPVMAGKATGDDQEIGFPVGNGRHRLVVRVTDAAGNFSTFKRAINVHVSNLAPALKQLTGPKEATQRFSIAGTPSSSGMLTLAGKSLPVQLGAGTAEIAMDLPDGTYPDATLSVRDEVGRTGSITVPEFTVDTTKPSLEVVRRDNDSATGRLVALITAEDGARVVWRVLDDSGKEVEQATYVASGRVRTVDVDLEEGTATLEVEASDAVGNGATEDFEAMIEADPLGAVDWIIFLVFLALVIGAGLLGWRKRDAVKAWAANRQHAGQVRKARKAYESALRGHAQQLQQHDAFVSAFEHQLAQWAARKQYLTHLHEEAQTTSGTEPASSELLGVKVKKGERIFAIVDGALIEKRTRQNVPVLVEADRGRVAITNLRVLFQGSSKKREWAFSNVEHVTNVSEDATLIEVSNRKSLSGVSYADTERTRFLLALALNPGPGERQHAVDTIAASLRKHTGSRPADPPPAPSAPLAPGILRETVEGMAPAR